MMMMMVPLQLVVLLTAIDGVTILNSRFHSLRGFADNALRGLGRGFGGLAHTLRQGDIGALIGVVLALIGIDLVLAVFLDEGGEIFNGARAGVSQGFGLGASWEELDRWETLDLIGHIVGGGVDFGNGDFGGGGIHGGELIVLRRKSMEIG